MERDTSVSSKPIINSYLTGVLGITKRIEKLRLT
jgi:hypothetical protein